MDGRRLCAAQTGEPSRPLHLIRRNGSLHESETAGDRSCTTRRDQSPWNHRIGQSRLPSISRSLEIGGKARRADAPFLHDREHSPASRRDASRLFASGFTNGRFSRRLRFVDRRYDAGERTLSRHADLLPPVGIGEITTHIARCTTLYRRRIAQCSPSRIIAATSGVRLGEVETSGKHHHPRAIGRV